jgi:hypothetical protein
VINNPLKKADVMSISINEVNLFSHHFDKSFVVPAVVTYELVLDFAV